MQTKVILFCYAYLAGIVWAMVSGVDPSRLPVLRLLTGIFMLAGAGFYLIAGYFRRGGDASEKPAKQWLTMIVLLALPALLLGYTRYISSNTVADTRIGVVKISAEKVDYQSLKPLEETSRIVIRKMHEMEEDLTLSVKGELEARLPVLDRQELVILDEEARWHFQKAKIEQESEDIIVRKEDPVGTTYVVPQPFTRIVAFERIHGPETATLEVYRLSNHAASFARSGRNQTKVKVLGRISHDPMVYDYKTVLPVTPQYIQYRPKGHFYKVNGGTIRVTIRPDMPGYSEYASSEAFGRDLQIYGGLYNASPAAIPGGFDSRRFLQNHNVYGQMSLYRPRGAEKIPIHYIKAGDAYREGHGLVEFSLRVRDKMLRVFKQTTPYPQSAFLGGVTLGLRYGLSTTPYRAADLARAEGELADDTNPSEHGTDARIVDDFRESGVNHVLAVSGLHATIITGMFMGIFTLLRMPRRMYVPIIIAILIIFAIITGARPSTLRAVIMNSIFLLAWAYLDEGLRSSVLLGVPLAAFMILLHNPLMVVDPSFTLSFGAILSLALLSGPFYEKLCKLHGNGLLAAGLIACVLTALGIWKWALVTSWKFWLVAAVVSWAIFKIGDALEKRNVRLIGSFGYIDIPPSIGMFLAAQFAIQIGMMIPLSAYYFVRWPFAGAYVNLIAIPLVGIVVQLGVLAGLIGLVPGVGIALALGAGAANWIFTTLFIWLAHESAVAFPYPYVSKPTIGALLVYYALCALFLWYRDILEGLKRCCNKVGIIDTTSQRIVMGLLFLAILSPLWLIGGEKKKPGLNVTLLSTGYSSSVLLETPEGKNILIDAGYVARAQARFNVAERNVMPYLCHRGIRHLDAAFALSGRPERIAGMATILTYTRVDDLFVAPNLEGIEDITSRAGLERKLYAGIKGGSQKETQYLYNELIGHNFFNQRFSLAKTLKEKAPNRINNFVDWDTTTHAVKAGQVLLEEPSGFKIEVLNPSEEPCTEYPLENQSLVLRIEYGEFSMLLTGDLHFEGQQKLVQNVPTEKLQADVMVVPHRGTALTKNVNRNNLKEVVERNLWDSLVPLLDAVNPEYAIFEYGNPRSVLDRGAFDARAAYALTKQFVVDKVGENQCLSTDSDLTIFIHTDGTDYEVTTQAERLRQQAGMEGTVEDMEVGF